MNVANEIVSVTICGREPLESNQHVDSSPQKRTILLRTTANEKLCHCGRVLLESHNHVDSSPQRNTHHDNLPMKSCVICGRVPLESHKHVDSSHQKMSVTICGRVPLESQKHVESSPKQAYIMKI